MERFHLASHHIHHIAPTYPPAYKHIHTHIFTHHTYTHTFTHNTYTQLTHSFCSLTSLVFFPFVKLIRWDHPIIPVCVSDYSVAYLGHEWLIGHNNYTYGGQGGLVVSRVDDLVVGHTGCNVISPERSVGHWGSLP